MSLLTHRKKIQIDRRESLAGIPYINPSAVIELIDGKPMAMKLTVHRGNGFLEPA